MCDLELAYKMIRSSGERDDIPGQWEWFVVLLMRDIDKRVSDVEDKTVGVPFMKKCDHEWVVHFINVAREEKVPQRTVNALIKDISVCRFCGSVSYIWEGKVVNPS